MTGGTDPSPDADRKIKCQLLRKSDVGKARKDRIEERANANQAKLAERDTPWLDPVPDVAPLLDEIVTEISPYVVASS